MRSGVLSDENIKLNCVEYTPMAVGSNLQHRMPRPKHAFTGIKPSRDMAFTVTKYPIDYIQNLALALEPNEVASVVNQATHQYRSHVHKIIDDDAESVVETKRRFNFDDDVARMGTLVGSLNLNQYTRQLGQKAFNKRFSDMKGILDPHTKTALMNLISRDQGDDDMYTLIDIVTKGVKSHVTAPIAREQLMHAFRDDDESLQKIEDAFEAARQHGVAPE